MQLRTLVWKEICERPAALLTCGLAVLLGVAALVAIRHVNVHSEQEVSRQLATLGANILILPKNATLQDYYAADLNGQTLLEEVVAKVFLSGFSGVERMSPKLCVPARLGDRDITLTGILPQSEFQTKATWQTVSLFNNKHARCKKAKCGPSPDAKLPESLAKQRSIEELRGNETVIGADVAEQTRLKAGSKVVLFDEQFTVLAVLPRTGTVDDSRVFAHLHTVQRLAKTGEVVSAIEVMGCCEDAAGQLVPQLAELLPEAKVVTISQVVATQVGVNRLMAGTSWFVLGILTVVGGASVAGAISANVRERRREIGTLMALGATPGYVARLFLLKALWLGLAGGLIGCLLGLAIATGLGPQWAGVVVRPLPSLCFAAVAGASVLAILAAYWPARRAARLDPCICFQEV